MPSTVGIRTALLTAADEDTDDPTLEDIARSIKNCPHGHGQSVAAVSSEQVILRESFLLVGNKRVVRIGVRDMNWVFWLIIAWLAVSVAVAVLVGRVIRTRDEREIPSPLHQDGNERWRDAGRLPVRHLRIHRCADHASHRVHGLVVCSRVQG